ncbi:hypothetical protein D3C81_2037770 [compost metagenome]
MVKINLAQTRCDRTGFAICDRLTVDHGDRRHKGASTGEESLLCGISLIDGESAFFKLDAGLGDQLQERQARAAGQNGIAVGARDDDIVLRHDVGSR